MAFGQAAGPPAQQRQIEELAALFERAGFSSFREARHPYGLNQRQAGGRFTATEATELIERLSAAEAVMSAAEEGSSPKSAEVSPPVFPQDDAAPPRSAASRAAERARAERAQRTLSSLDDAPLVAELERRGWCCIPPVFDSD